MTFKYIKMMAKGKTESISLPLLEIYFPKFKVICLVDSGAENSYLPASIGEAMGVNVRGGEVDETGKGITGKPFTAYFHTLEYKVGGWEYKARIGFSYELGVPFGILGRRGFFEFFKICIDHRKEEIEVKPYIKK